MERNWTKTEEKVFDRQEAFSEIFRVLAPGGAAYAGGGDVEERSDMGLLYEEKSGD